MQPKSFTEYLRENGYRHDGNAQLCGLWAFEQMLELQRQIDALTGIKDLPAPEPDSQAKFFITKDDLEQYRIRYIDVGVDLTGRARYLNQSVMKDIDRIKKLVADAEVVDLTGEGPETHVYAEGEKLDVPAVICPYCSKPAMHIHVYGKPTYSWYCRGCGDWVKS